MAEQAHRWAQGRQQVATPDWHWVPALAGQGECGRRDGCPALSGQGVDRYEPTNFFPPPRLRGAHVPLAAIGCGSKQTGRRRDNLTTPFTVAGLIMRPVEPTWDGQGRTHWMAALGTSDADEESMGMSIPDLMRFSRDKDPGVRLAAVELLSGFPFNETALLPALESAQLDADARVRGAAVQAVQSRKAVDREVQRRRKLWPAGTRGLDENMTFSLTGQATRFSSHWRVKDVRNGAFLPIARRLSCRIDDAR